MCMYVCMCIYIYIYMIRKIQESLARTESKRIESKRTPAAPAKMTAASITSTLNKRIRSYFCKLARHGRCRPQDLCSLAWPSNLPAGHFRRLIGRNLY